MTAWRTLDGQPTRIIAHRGASGYFPEHSRPAYERAVVDGADILEPDLVPSSDGILFARHDAWLSCSTDVARRPAFVGRRERGISARNDWCVDRFSATELRSLHALQVLPRRDHSHDGLHSLLDFDAVLDIAQTARLLTYPELKRPNWFLKRGIDTVALLIEVLTRRGLRGSDAPVWVQCFESEYLQPVHEALGVKVFPLLGFRPWAPRRQWQHLLDATREFASGIAVDKRWLLLPDAAAWIDRVHSEGRAVHAFTFRDDVLPSMFSTPDEELMGAFTLGVDAVFCDFQDTGVRVRDTFSRRLRRGQV